MVAALSDGVPLVAGRDLEWSRGQLERRLAAQMPGAKG